MHFEAQPEINLISLIYSLLTNKIETWKFLGIQNDLFVLTSLIYR